MADLKTEVEVTAQTVVKKLREIVQPPGKKGLWLRQLSDQKLAEVYHRLRMGQAVYHVVKIAQNDWGVMRNSSAKSLARGMTQFRDKIIGELKVDATKSPKGEKQYKSRVKRAKRITEKLDGLGRLRWLIEVQTDRLEALLTKEKATMPFKSTEKTVEVLGELVDKYLQYQMDLGLLDAKPPELNVNVHHKFSRLIEALPDDGSRLISAANRFLDMAMQKALPMKEADDGTFQFEEDEDGETIEEDGTTSSVGV